MKRSILCLWIICRGLLLRIERVNLPLSRVYDAVSVWVGSLKFFCLSAKCSPATLPWPWLHYVLGPWSMVCVMSASKRYIDTRITVVVFWYHSAPQAKMLQFLTFDKNNLSSQTENQVQCEICYLYPGPGISKNRYIKISTHFCH